MEINTASVHAGHHLDGIGDVCRNVTSSLFTFPFTQQELRHGWVALPIVVVLYTFVSLALISEHYFVPAIEMFTKDFQIPSNVAGASLMAAAASAPQLANTLIGLFVVDDDIGVGAVVGAAFISVFFIPGVCGLSVGGRIQLSCLPMTRDCVAYMAGSVLLLHVIYDSRVYWYESVMLMLGYVVYIIIVVLHNPIERFVKKYKLDGDYFTGCALLACRKCLWTKAHTEAAPLVTETAASSYMYDATSKNIEEIPLKKVEESSLCCEHADMEIEEVDPDKRQYRCIVAVPQNKWLVPVWVLVLPILLLIFISIPDPRRPGCWRRLYGLTLLSSVIWIGFMSFLLVWMVTVIGDTMAASQVVMGMTLLAIGGSLPDLFNSVFATRDGYGEMGLANTMGSVMFDILFCLGLPWFIKVVVGESPGYVQLEENLVLVVVLCLCSAVLVYITLLCTAWVINHGLSVFYILCYCAFISLAVYLTLTHLLPGRC